MKVINFLEVRRHSVSILGRGKIIEFLWVTILLGLKTEFLK